MVVKSPRRKAMGVHYTPPKLARFVAERLVERAILAPGAPLRILDPACGDGELLLALREELRHAWSGEVIVYGVEAEELAVHQARRRLAGWNDAEVHILHGDFLELSAREGGQSQFWESEQPDAICFRSFDLAIANPPYVRTQILGASTAQRLADRFGLMGRVDLYHAFWVALTQALCLDGSLGIITSNRFLSTAGGASLRRFLARNYAVNELVDLGDTKLFEAAVLPAVFIGRRVALGSSRSTEREGNFLRVYSCAGSDTHVETYNCANEDVYCLLKHGRPGRYRVSEGCFDLARGTLQIPENPAGVWALTTCDERDWLDRIRCASVGVFGDVSTVRVGVKTTADEVFIRSDWDALPGERIPEPELLHPLLSHEHATRWSRPGERTSEQLILYPHEVVAGVRRPIDLDRYPRARAYFESCRERLERRTYVLNAGRRWYEVWVPQDPEAWRQTKIVFPDISPESRFYLDTNAWIVDGDSYWITLRSGIDPAMLYVLLGLANSHIMARFHDLAFNNRLYSGRRRYITQYVSRYPLPRLSSTLMEEFVAVVKTLVSTSASKTGAAATAHSEVELNRLVAQAFGVREVDCA